MKYMIRILALTLTILPLLAAAQLGNNDRLVTQVPFEFVVGTRTIPAGECSVRLAAPGWRTLMVHNQAAKMALFAPTSLDSTKQASDHYALVFHKLGDKYFLAEIKLAGSNAIYRLPQNPAEAELLSHNVKLTEKILLASVK